MSEKKMWKWERKSVIAAKKGEATYSRLLVGPDPNERPFVTLPCFGTRNLSIPA